MDHIPETGLLPSPASRVSGGCHVMACGVLVLVHRMQAHPNNSVIGFHDNSSAIRGGPVTPVLPVTPGGPSAMQPLERDWDVLLTAETHNFPCAVAPYPGAETGVGGRIRDTHATGRGSIMGAATAGYCVGNLHLDNYRLPHEVRCMAGLYTG